MPLIKQTSNFRNLKFNNRLGYVPTTSPGFTTLLDLQTRLTSLKFGNDRPGYGSSGLPYIQTQIPGELTSPGNFKPIFKGTGNLDYPLRGGSINFQVGQESFTLSNQIDSERIRLFFKDAPRGTAFINKQVGLQLTNPKIETGNVLFGINQSNPVPGILENTRVYNFGRNTLSQVLVSGTGGHALRHGLVPFAAYQKHYYYMVSQQNVNNNSASNRLVNLNALKMTSTTSQFINPVNVPDINLVNTLGISLNRNILFQYLGGPGSTYGIGTTSIKRVVDTTVVKNFRVMSYDLLKQQEINRNSVESSYKKIKDFRTAISGSINLANTDDTTKKIFTGSWTEEQTIDFKFYIKNGLNNFDRMNSSYPFVFDNNKAPWEIDEITNKDLIKFVFEAINNDNTSKSTAIFFRAFLESGLTDNNTAQWSAFKYLGRGENFYTYQGFDRTVSFTFRVAAGSERELKPMYNRLNTLISQVYPDYSDKGIMRAPIIRLTVGDYFYRMPGFLESVNITTENGYPWEINLYNNETDLAQLPQVVNVAVSFKPILDELPRRANGNLGNPKIMANNDYMIDSSYNELGNTIDRSTIAGDTIANENIA